MEGGWKLDRKGRLRLRAGGRLHKLSTIFSNPEFARRRGLHEPWTYDYDNLISAPASDDFQVARPVVDHR